MKNEATIVMKLLNNEIELFITDLDNDLLSAQKVEFMCLNEENMLYEAVIRVKKKEPIDLTFDFDELCGLEDMLKLLAAFCFPYHIVLFAIRAEENTNNDLIPAYYIAPQKNGKPPAIFEYDDVLQTSTGKTRCFSDEVVSTIAL